MSLPDITPKYKAVEVPGVGTLQMRALAFEEAQAVLQKIHTEQLETVLDALKLAIDETPEEIETWVKKGDSGLVEKVFTKLMAISGGNEEEAAALGN